MLNKYNFIQFGCMVDKIVFEELHSSTVVNSSTVYEIMICWNIYAMLISK